MLAAETIFEALKAGDTSSKMLSAFPSKSNRVTSRKSYGRCGIFTIVPAWDARRIFSHGVPADQRGRG